MNHLNVDSVLRTARHLVNFLGETKSNAAQLATSLDAVEKGYFSPTQDEQAQALLVTYTQVRAALLDLIHDLQAHWPKREPDHSVSFIAGYAAALALVDAARFLRSEVEDRPVVRQKLNQPIPEFGIESGTYDAVQRSLIGARHAWKLRRADRLFASRHSQIRDSCATKNADDLFAYVEQHRHMVDVAPASFAMARWSTGIRQAWEGLQRRTAARAMYGLQKFGGDMMSNRYLRRGHQPHLPDRIVRSVANTIRPGDVVVVRKEYALTNYFLPGFWPHAALYLGQPDELERRGLRNHEEASTRWSELTRAAQQSGRCVLESMKDGVLLRCWSSPLASDSLVLLRPQLDEDTITEALARALVHEGKNYDFDFDFSRSDRLVCTEVIYRAYDGLGPMRFALQSRAGRVTLSGYDVVCMARDGNGLDVVAAFVPSESRELLCGTKAKKVVARILDRG